ncbi:MAG: hypothetical protein ACTSVE_04795 [Candidatus Helarchaeota archaeon]
MIIHLISGRPIFEKNYTEFQADSSIFSGVLTTLKLLINECHIGEICHFSTKNYNIVFSSSENILTVFILDVDEDLNKIEHIAFKISKTFESKYGNLKNWNGNLSEFEDFNNELDYILKHETKNEVIQIGKWAQHIFGGELHVITSNIANIILDNGEKEIFHSLKSLNFIKLLKNDNPFNEISTVIEYCKTIDPFDKRRKKENLISYFPSQITFIILNRNDITGNELRDFINSNFCSENTIIPNKIKEENIPMDFFKCKIEFWNWNKQNPKKL